MTKDTKSKDSITVFTSSENKLQVLIRHANKLAFGVINLKEDYTCKYGCGHWTTDYCECECHNKEKNLLKRIKKWYP